MMLDYLKSVKLKIFCRVDVTLVGKVSLYNEIYLNSKQLKDRYVY